MDMKRTAAQIAADKLRTGRPPKKPAQRQSEKVTVYLTKAEFKLMDRLSRQEGISMASLIMRPWREKGN